MKKRHRITESHDLLEKLCNELRPGETQPPVGSYGTVPSAVAATLPLSLCRQRSNPLIDGENLSPNEETGSSAGRFTAAQLF
jgi:hypothetical protein